MSTMLRACFFQREELNSKEKIPLLLLSYFPFEKGGQKEDLNLFTPCAVRKKKRLNNNGQCGGFSA
jgi:hypothetical protein